MFFNSSKWTEAPKEDASPIRKKGAARFFEVLGRDGLSFYKASMLCCLGCLPGFILMALGFIGSSVLFTLLGGIVGGMLGAPFLCGLIDTILRSLRDEPGFWWVTYKKAWRQNWKDSLLPGFLLGLLSGSWLSMLMILPAMEAVPSIIWICMGAGLIFAAGLFTYAFAQIPLVHLTPAQFLKNCIFFFLGYLPRTLLAAAVQAAYWVLFVLFLPLTLPLMLVTGFWLPWLIAVMVVYQPLDTAFSVEETIRHRREEELNDSMENHSMFGPRGDD